ncbi:MAG: ZIP family metal transporter [Mahellales bacterium]|jgi:ZIP family zinc transporter
MIEYLSQFDLVTVGIIATLITGFATGMGAIPIFFTRDVPKKVMDALLGAAAGIMLAATSFSLIVPAIENAGGGIWGATIALIGILCGGLFLDFVDKFFPDTNLQSRSINNSKQTIPIDDLGFRLRKVWLFVIAITIHNFPEGMAVGVGFGSGDIANGLSIAIAIGLQNMPEGLAVALPLIRVGYSRARAFLIALSTGLVEPIGGLLGVGLVQIARPMLPFSLAFAAGSMLFVISHEIIPETQGDNGHSKLATHALMVGFVIMMFLDNALG